MCGAGVHMHAKDVKKRIMRENGGARFHVWKSFVASASAKSLLYVIHVRRRRARFSVAATGGSCIR